jgi:3-deoxy-manno-octulosonate cytidylyltransferase (CMP-KDO synthetase)
MYMKKVLAIIPARFASTRFPGKPLADIAGKSMIQRVYEQVVSCSGISEVLIATDNVLIKQTAEGFGARVMMTNENCVSGTDRCAEALLAIGGSWDVVLNVQGDEPFIRPEQLDELISRMNSPEVEIGTLVSRIKTEADVQNPNVVKAVLAQTGEALYFSRSAIPFVRGGKEGEWLHQADFFRHFGLYAFRQNVLEAVAQLPPGKLELAESLEQLRWLESGFSIYAAETVWESHGIDTPEDLENALRFLS